MQWTKTVLRKIEIIMSSAFDWKKSLINSISESMPEIECLLIINSIGGVMEHNYRES